MASPRDEYLNRLRARTALAAALDAIDARFSYARLAVFGLALLCAAAAWRGTWAWWTVLVPATAFLVLVARHDRIVRRRDQARRAAEFYEHGLARMGDTWIGRGEPGTRFADPAHLYAADLDLFGPGSLFELLSIARTRAGEDTLASWLKTPASPGEIVDRQTAVVDLAPRLDLREAISQAGSDVEAAVDSSALVAWAGDAGVLLAPWQRGLAAVLTLAAVVSGIQFFVSGDPAALLTTIFAELLFFAPRFRRLTRALHAAEGPARDLDVLAHVLARLESEPFTAPRLATLRATLDTGGVPASVAIARLHRLVELHAWQHNQFFAPVAAFLLWGTHLAGAIDAWRRRHGTHVATWLQTVGEFEALASLACYHYEHPDDPFPVIEDGRAGALFEGDGLGHPLLPAARVVRNDVRLVPPTRLLVVSGSNMSGKSTLLRTVGINTVLAQAGAPVRATRLRISPLSPGATLRIQDSLQEGRSRFYAEITRLRALADTAAGPRPLLFLLDEILHGTNSHDRTVGASGVLKGLLERGAIGLVTTHDLALTAVADTLAPAAANVHFDDRFDEGELLFDYAVKPGPVTRSNALALMRAVGLDFSES